MPTNRVTFQHQLLAYCDGEDKPRVIEFISDLSFPNITLELATMPRVLRIEWHAREILDNAPVGAWISPAQSMPFERK